MDRRKVLTIFVGYVAPLASLLIGWLIFASAASRPDTVNGLEVYYPRGSGTIRECPDTDCRAVGVLQGDMKVAVNSWVQGSVEFDSDRWAATNFRGETRYVHSHFLAPQSLSVSSLPEIGFNIVAFGLVILSVLGARRGATVPADRNLYTSLVGLAITGGIVASIIAFGFSRLDGQTLPSFLSGASINLGSGLIGAAVTFVLFEIFIGRGKAQGQEAVELMRDLQREIAQLRESLEQLQETARKPNRGWLHRLIP